MHAFDAVDLARDWPSYLSERLIWTQRTSPAAHPYKSPSSPAVSPSRVLLLSLFLSAISTQQSLSTLSKHAPSHAISHLRNSLPSFNLFKKTKLFKMTGGKSGGKASGSKNSQSYVLTLFCFSHHAFFALECLLTWIQSILAVLPRRVLLSPSVVFIVCSVRVTTLSVLVPVCSNCFRFFMFFNASY